MSKAELPQDRLSDLAQQLNTALENRDTATIGTLAEIVERLYGEMSLMANHQDLLAGTENGDGGNLQGLLGDVSGTGDKEHDYSEDELALLASLVEAAE